MTNNDERSNFPYHSLDDDVETEVPTKSELWLEDVFQGVIIHAHSMMLKRGFITAQEQDEILPLKNDSKNVEILWLEGQELPLQANVHQEHLCIKFRQAIRLFLRIFSSFLFKFRRAFILILLVGAGAMVIGFGIWDVSPLSVVADLIVVVGIIFEGTEVVRSHKVRAQ